MHCGSDQIAGIQIVGIRITGMQIIGIEVRDSEGERCNLAREEEVNP